MLLLIFNYETKQHTRVPIFLTTSGVEYVAPYLLPEWADVGAASAALDERFNLETLDNVMLEGVTHNGIFYLAEVPEEELVCSLSP